MDFSKPQWKIYRKNYGIFSISTTNKEFIKECLEKLCSEGTWFDLKNASLHVQKDHVKIQSTCKYRLFAIIKELKINKIDLKNSILQASE